jgi:hypothetical protein
MPSYARLLIELTREAATRCEATLEPPHWDGTGKREGTYCLRCAKRLFRASIDGGWIGEEDSPPHCERCRKPLDFTFSSYGVEQMLETIEECGIHTDHDAYCVHRMMNAGGNPLLTESCGDWKYKPEWAPRIKAIYDAASGGATS